MILTQPQRNILSLAFYCQPDVSAHFHREAELIHILEGSLTVSNESGSFRLPKGDFACFYLRDPQPADGNGKPGLSNEALCSRLLPKGCPDFGLMQCNPPPAPTISISEIFSCILREDAERRPGYQAAVALQVIRLFLLVMRAFDTRPIRPEEQARRKTARHCCMPSAGIWTIIIKKISHWIRLRRIAATLNTIFLTASGKPLPCALWTILRSPAPTSRIRPCLFIEKVIDIAYGAGFRNIRSFNRMFQKYFHLTPSAYRTRAT